MYESDEAGFALLAKNVDLTKPVKIRYYFYLPKEEAACALSSLLTSRNIVNTIRPSPIEVQEWGVQCILSELVSQSRLSQLREGFSKLAAEFGGEYDGWELLLDP